VCSPALGLERAAFPREAGCSYSTTGDFVSEPFPVGFVPVDDEVGTSRNTSSRWSTPSVWMLAFTPWLTGACLFAALLLHSRGVRDVFQYGALVLPYLFALACAQYDVQHLRRWGHRRVAHWAWSLLGTPVYLVARTLVLRRRTGIGSAPMWVWLVNLLVVTGTTLLLFVTLATLAVPEALDSGAL
jgi:hypothetical protein